MQEIEKWLPITGLDGYQISSFGNVLGKKSKRLYKTHKTKKGYLMLRIPLKKYAASIHRIVAEHFVIYYGDRSKLQVNHKDGNKLNNHASNLEYMTCKENINHAIKTGLRSATINLRSKAIFDRTQILAMRDAFVAGYGNQEISKYFGCSHSAISKIRTGKHYPSIV